MDSQYGATFLVKNVTTEEAEDVTTIPTDYINGRLLLGLDQGLFESQADDCILQVKSITSDEVVVTTLSENGETKTMSEGDEMNTKHNDVDYSVKLLAIETIE